MEDELSKIFCPTLVIVGDEDVATSTPEKAAFIHQEIAGSKLEVIVGAGHSSGCIEKPDQVNRILGDWLR